MKNKLKNITAAIIVTILALLTVGFLYCVFSPTLKSEESKGRELTSQEKKQIMKEWEEEQRKETEEGYLDIANPNGTKWIHFNQTLFVNVNTFEWRTPYGSTEGSCIICKGEEAESAYMEAVDIQAEKLKTIDSDLSVRFKESQKERLGQLTEKHPNYFVITLIPTKTVLRGEKVDSINSTYLGWIEYVQENINREEYALQLSLDDFEEGFLFKPYELSELRNPGGQAYNIEGEYEGFSYIIPAGFGVVRSESGSLLLAASEGREIEVFDGPVGDVAHGRYSLIDSFPIIEKRGDAWWCEKQDGPMKTYVCYFERGEKYYCIRSNDEKSINAFYNSIQF